MFSTARTKLSLPFSIADILMAAHAISDLNPAAQGSSLTEGKRGRRSKKNEVNGDGRGSPNGEDEPDCEIQVPEKKKEDKVTDC